MSRRGRTARVASRQRVETLGNGASAPTNKTIDKVETGELYFIDHNHASALTITLPPMQDGAYFKFIFKTALTADGSVVIATSEATAGSIIGSIFEQVTGGSNAASGVDTDDGTAVKITLSDDIHPGSWVECFCDGSVWHAHARLNVSGVGESGFGDYSPPAPSNPAMTRLAAGFASGYVAQVPLANVAFDTVDGSPSAGEGGWEDNIYQLEGPSSTSQEILRISYGKDGSGNPHWVAVSDNDSDSLYQVSAANFYTDDQDGTQRWAQINASGAGGGIKQHKVLWGNGVWISVGNLSSNNVILRSTDGADFDAVNVKPVLTDTTGGKAAYSASKIVGLTTDGNGTWWFGGGSQIYKSTDDGATWAFEVDLSSLDVVGIRHMAFTNNTVVVLAKFTIDGGNSIRVVTATASDTTDWGTPAIANDFSGSPEQKMTVDYTKLCAAGNGRVICIDRGYCMSFDVDGKTATRSSNRLNIADDGGAGGTGNCTDIATDGEGTWYISTTGHGTGGDLVRSTDNGANWSVIVTDIDGDSAGGDRNMEGLAVDRYLPL